MSMFSAPSKSTALAHCAAKLDPSIENSMFSTTDFDARFDTP
jgi:hypothetical protein